MKPILLLSLSTLVGCTAFTSLPFGGGGSTTYDPRPSSSAPAAVADGDEAAPAPAGGDDEAIPAPAAPRGKLACVRDAAGSSFSSATKLGRGVIGGCLDTSATDVYTLTAGPNRGGTIFGNGPAGSDSTGAEKPSGHYSKPYTIEITAGEAKRKKTRVSKR